jgi:TonB-linked SusC/RagA family outer membrane protein
MKFKQYASNFHPLLFIKIIFFCQIAKAQDARWLDTTYVSLHIKKQPINTIAGELGRQCSCTVNASSVEPWKTYSPDFTHKTMRYVLEYFEQEGFEWKPIDNGVSIWNDGASTTAGSTKRANTNAAVKKQPLQGYVTDIYGEAVPGANVLVKGRKQGTQTDASGHFSLNVEDPVVTLIFRSMGFHTVEIQGSAAKILRVVLSEDPNKLDEVRIQGYIATARRFSTSVLSTVQASDIQRYPVGNVAAALQGRVKGLNVTPSNGAPGAAFELEARGRNSIVYKTNPLLIINAVPFAPNNNHVNSYNSVIAQNTRGGISAINGIHPGIIESIDVLKDASATSIYGSRGANGVIIIRTKRDTLNGIRLSADFATGFSVPTFTYNMLNTPGYIALRREGFANDELEPNNTPGTDGYAPDLIDTITNTDWQEELLGNTAATMDGNVSISLGIAKGNALIKLGHHRETTPFSPDMRYKNSYIYSWVQTTLANGRIGLQSSFYLSGDDNQSYDGSLRSLYTRPNAWMYKPDGTLNWGDESDPFQNPGADHRKTYIIRTNNLVYNLVPTISLSPRISLKVNIGYSGVFVNEHLILPIAAQPPASSGMVTGSSSFGTNHFQSFITEPMAEYASKYLKLLIGASYQYATHNCLTYTGRGYTNDALLHSIASAAYVADSSMVESEYKYGSVFGQVHYNLLARYMFNLTYRMDGSSRFSPEHRLGHFGAIGAGWIITQEPFMEPLTSVLEYGKLMASYGVTGNDQIGDYQYLDTWGPSNGTPFQGMEGFSPESLYNPEYYWERCRKFDAALDLQFKKGGWSLNINYYLNRSDKQLIEFELPAQTGFNRVLKNFDAMIENRGWELSVAGNIFKSPNLQIRTDVNVTIPRNELIRFNQMETTPYGSSLVMNKPVSALKVYQYLGVDPQNGLSLLGDKDGDRTITDKDRAYGGHLDPVIFGGASLEIQWKKAEVSLFGEYKKQTVPSYTYNAILGDLLLGMAVNHPTLADNHWRKAGDIATYPKASTRRTSEVHANRQLVLTSSRAYTSGSFFTFRNVYMAYTFSGPWLSDRGIQSIKCFLKGRNLFTITPYNAGDPETANLFALPMLRTIEAGFQVNFKDLLNKPK